VSSTQLAVMMVSFQAQLGTSFVVGLKFDFAVIDQSRHSYIPDWRAARAASLDQRRS